MQGCGILGEEGGGVWALALPDLKKCKKCPFKNNEKSSKSFLFRQSLGERVPWIHEFIAQKMKFFIKDFFSKCDQICRKLRIWSHLLKKSLMENLILVQCFSGLIKHKAYNIIKSELNYNRDLTPEVFDLRWLAWLI